VETLCNNTCVYTQSSTDNCGACGTICDTDATCTLGSCACPTGELDCRAGNSCSSGHCGSGYACINDQTDPDNCGGCSNVCDTNATCTGGKCGCPTGEIDCDRTQQCTTDHCGAGYACVDDQTDPNNCGGCGITCDTNSTCVKGTCTCPANEIDCSYTTGCASKSCGEGFACVNNQTSPSNCGLCGRTCDTNATCAAGACACPAHEKDCFGTQTCSTGYCGTGYLCVNVEMSQPGTNCGACGNTCGGGHTCCNGVCCNDTNACSANGTSN
jgi:hypothetical protein